MHVPWNERSSNDYNCLHTIVAITAYKAFYAASIKKRKLTLF